MKIIVGWSICFLFLLGCKKDRLTEDKEILIGKWEWIMTKNFVGYCDYDADYAITITPETKGVHYSMEFLKGGKVKFYSGASVIETHRVVFGEFGEYCSADPISVHFVIYLDNQKKHIAYKMVGCVSADAITLTHGFPFSVYDATCEHYTSYFKRKI